MPLTLNGSISYDIRERIEMGEIDSEFMRILSMAADHLTKHVGAGRWEVFYGND